MVEVILVLVVFSDGLFGFLCVDFCKFIVEKFWIKDGLWEEFDVLLEWIFFVLIMWLVFWIVDFRIF